MIIETGAFNGSVWLGRFPGISVSQQFYRRYNLYSYFSRSIQDKVSRTDWANTSTGPHPLLVNGVYTEFPSNTMARNEDGCHTYGAYTQLVPYSEATASWTGSGPWTQSINLATTGVYTVSTNLSGATITITAGTATLDAGASATYGTPDKFEVTVAGTVTISTDVADPMAQITKDSYALPYAKNDTANPLVISHNYADADEGNKLPITGKLLDALDGVADGVDVTPIKGEWLTDNSVSTVDEVYAFNYSGAYAVLLRKNSVFVADSYNEIKLTVNLTSGSFALFFGNTAALQTISASGEYIIRGISTDGDALNRLQFASAAFIGTIKIEHTKQISPAKGKMVVEWTPMFDYNVSSLYTIPNILTIDSSKVNYLRLLWSQLTSGYIGTSDGVNSASATVPFMRNIKYTITTQYGLHPTETLSSEKVLNGDFTDWTGDDPDDWTVDEVGDATSNITQNPSGQCRLISNGTLARISQNALVVGKEYYYSIDIKDVSSGSIKLQDGVSIIATFSTTGIKTGTFTATGVQAIIARTSICDVTFDNLSIKATNQPKMQLTVTDGTTTWQSALSDFEGSFSPADYVSLGYQNSYWQAVKSIKIYKEPSW